MSESVKFVIPAGWVEAPYIEATHIINGRGEIAAVERMGPSGFKLEGAVLGNILDQDAEALGIIGLKRAVIEFEVAPRWFAGSMVIFCAGFGLTEGRRYRFVATPIEGGTE